MVAHSASNGKVAGSRAIQTDSIRQLIAGTHPSTNTGRAVAIGRKDQDMVIETTQWFCNPEMARLALAGFGIGTTLIAGRAFGQRTNTEGDQ